MDIQYSKSVRYAPSFNGNDELPANDQFFITLVPLEFDAFSLVSVAQIEAGIQQEGKPTEGKLNQAKIGMEGLQVLRKVFVDFCKPNVTLIENLKINGVLVTVDDIATNFRLAGLLAEIVMKLVTITSLTEDDVKN